MDPWYATREDVMSSTDVKVSARNSAQLDADLDAASRTVENLLHRKFFPWSGTRYFDYPDTQSARAWRLWLGQYEAISVTSMTMNDGSSILPASFFLYPQDGPPYDRIEINTGTSSAFTAGSTWQNAIGVLGVFGYSNQQTPAGTLTGSINSVVTQPVGISDSSLVGVGSLLTVGTERMIVTGKANIDTTADLSSDIAASAGVTSIPITSGALVNVGELITVGSELMQVVDKTGNTVIVKRSISGSVLAAHSSGDAVYAPRSLTIVRGATGTTAGAANNGDAVTAWQCPGPVRTLTVAIASYNNQQRLGGWSEKQIKAQQDAITSLITQTYATYGRPRTAAI